MATPQWKSTTRFYATANASSGSVAKPSNLAVGDVVLLHVYAEASNLTIAANDFQPLTPHPYVSDHTHGVLWKVITDPASEPANYTANWGVSDWYELAASAYSGCDTANPVEQYKYASRSTSGTSTPPVDTVAPGGTERLYVWSGTNFNNYQTGSAWTPPTQGGTWSNRGGDQLIGIATHDHGTSTAAIAGITGSCPSSGSSNAAVVVLRPTGGVAPAPNTKRFFLAG